MKLNKRLIRLFQERNKWEEKKDRCYFWLHSWQVVIPLISFIPLVVLFGPIIDNLSSEGLFLKGLGLFLLVLVTMSVFFFVVNGFRAYHQLKELKKCFKKIAQIDQQIAEELETVLAK